MSKEHKEFQDKLKEIYFKYPLIKAKASPLKFNCDLCTTAKTVNNETGNSILKFVNSVNTNINNTFNINAPDMVIEKLLI